MSLRTELGNIDICSDVFADIVNVVANSCYGVNGIERKRRGVDRISKNGFYHKGIKIEKTVDGVNIELHIVVRHGINIAAAGTSIISEIRYNVERLTGISVGRVDICVDSIMTK